MKTWLKCATLPSSFPGSHVGKVWEVEGGWAVVKVTLTSQKKLELKIGSQAIIYYFQASDGKLVYR